MLKGKTLDDQFSLSTLHYLVFFLFNESHHFRYTHLRIFSGTSLLYHHKGIQASTYYSKTLIVHIKLLLDREYR